MNEILRCGVVSQWISFVAGERLHTTCGGLENISCLGRLALAEKAHGPEEVTGLRYTLAVSQW